MATGISKTKWNGEVSKDGQLTELASLSYSDKMNAEVVLATKPQNYVVANSIDSTNSYKTDSQLYFDDNLPVLATLLRNPEICGQIRLVYIDPPYATGSVFKSRNQQDAYADLLTGAEYLEFMRQRLILLHKLLAEDGSIYVHLDQTMMFHVKLLLDEIFGENNFRNLITRKKSNPKNYTRKTYGNISDFILFYTKSDNYVWNRAYDQWTEEDAKREYPCVEKSSGRRYKKVPVHAPGTRNGATGEPWRGKMPPEGKHWQYTPAKLDEMDARGEIYWSPTGNPRRKVYLDQSKGKPVQDIWLDGKDAYNQNIKITGYPTEKNPVILKRIIEASSNPNDLVLDCFAGSGTTLDVASELNRRWIGVDSSKLSIQTVVKRFLFGMQVMGDFVTKKQDNSLSRNRNLLPFQIHCREKALPTIAEILSTNYATEQAETLDDREEKPTQAQQTTQLSLNF